MAENNSVKDSRRMDYTGLKIGAILAPLLLFFIYLGKTDMGLMVFIDLGAVILAIKLRWNLRQHVWFWGIIVFIFALHVPLFVIVRWPQGSTPLLFYAIPVGIADFLIISGALGLAERLLSKTSSSDSEKR